MFRSLGGVALFYSSCILMLISSISPMMDEETQKRLTRDVAVDMKARYDNESLTCPEDRPAYECSGILIRGIDSKQQLPYAWSMKKLNQEKGSFSMAYLRRDQPFSTFPSENYNSGFVLLPRSQIPSYKMRYFVYCAFPLDAESDSRANRGCGQSADDQNGTSQYCDRQHINTLQKWVEHFQLLDGEDFVRKQCGFNTNDGSAEAAKNFAVCIEAKRYLQKHGKYALRNNEIKVQAWKETEVCDVPFEAFFYVIDSSTGIEQAKKYRSDYLAACDIWIPIIGICLPQDINGELCHGNFKPLLD